MTDEESRMLDEGAAYLGPTLREVHQMLRKLDRVPLCAVCPAAQWYLIMNSKGDEELEAFCTRFRGVMYDGRKVITLCDAREDAIAESTAPQR